jgi:hypothetical protein
MFLLIDQWLIGMTVLFYQGLFPAHWRYTESAGGSMIGFQIGVRLPEVRTSACKSE